MDINLSAIENLTPINHMDLYHRICYCVPINVSVPVLFTLIYTLVMDLKLPDKIFGTWFKDPTNTTVEAQVLRWAFTEERYREKLIMINFLYLILILVLPEVLA